MCGKANLMWSSADFNLKYFVLKYTNVLSKTYDEIRNSYKKILVDMMFLISLPEGCAHPTASTPKDPPLQFCEKRK